MKAKDFGSKMFDEFVQSLQEKKITLRIPENIDVKFNLKTREVFFFVKK